MILEIDDWIFDTDIAVTLAYSTSEAQEHCTCDYCRNFYAAVDDTYPELRPFLAQFGVDVEAPEELMPFGGEKEMWFDGCYAVNGTILSVGSKPIICGGVEIRPMRENELHINYRCPEPCFFLHIHDAVVPWVLDEPIHEAVSPANQPSFLKRMWERLFGRQPNENMMS